MAKKALLVIDMLNDFVRRGAALEVPAARGIVPNIKRRIERARKEKIPIVYICDSHKKNDPEFVIWPSHCIKGTKGAKVVDEIIPHRDDFIVKKTTYSGFYKTSLDKLLKRLKVKELIITGVVTNICILYTASDSLLRGYKVIVPGDSVAGLNRGDHNFALRQIKNVLGGTLI